MPRITFEVEGKSTFPLDMLRYDRCYPIEEIYAISESVRCGSGDQLHWVKLRCENGIEAYTPCFERWSSFGWYVVYGSVQVEG